MIYQDSLYEANLKIIKNEKNSKKIWLVLSISNKFCKYQK